MAEIIRMPKMSDTMTEGVIAEWHKQVGDTVKPGDIVAEVETDKATMDLEAYEAGTILHIGVSKGQAVPVDGILYIVGKAGESFEHLLNGNTTKEKAPEQQEQPPISSTSTNTSATASQPSNNKVDTSQIKAKVERMPKMSDTMTEGVVVAWHKQVGDTIKSGDLLAEIETDKAVMELEAYEGGTLLYIGAQEGEKVEVDAVLYIVGEAGADYKALLSAEQNTSLETQPTSKENGTKTVSATTPDTSEGQTQTEGRIKASPLAKKIASELGYDLNQIKGSGDGGRIVKSDVENFKPSTTQQPQQPSSPQQEQFQPSSESKPTNKPTTPSSQNFIGESFEEVPVSQMRKTIARRLAESKFSAPHFYLTIEVIMDKVVEMRKTVNDLSPVKVSFNDIIIKAAAVALRQHPQVNSSWLGDKIRHNQHIHIGMAVAVEEGLLVPVIRFADMKSLSTIAGEAKDLGGKAKNRQLQPKDWEGNTFTISNLGMFGIEEFTAIINPPDACILAVGGIKETVIVRNGEMKVGNIMKMTLSCDHRVVDGATGAAFLQTLKGILEEPMRLLV